MDPHEAPAWWAWRMFLLEEELPTKAHFGTRSQYLTDKDCKQHLETTGTAFTCSGFSPVKQNMPIWSVMCCQLWEDPSFLRLDTSCVRMLMIRSAMPFTSTSLRSQPRNHQSRAGTHQFPAYQESTPSTWKSLVPQEHGGCR